MSRNFEKKASCILAPVSYFKRVEKNTFRGDPDEALFKLLQSDNVNIRFKLENGSDEFSDINRYNGLVGQVKIAINEIEELGISCFAKAKVEKELLLVNECMLDFGAHLIVINNLPEFYKRVLAYVKENKISFESKEIEYVDPTTYNGEMGIFRKTIEYAQQNEVRFVVYNKPAPFLMKLGSLEDITSIIEMSKGTIIEKPKGQ